MRSQVFHVFHGTSRVRRDEIGHQPHVRAGFAVHFVEFPAQTLEQAEAALNRPKPTPVKKKNKNAALLYEQKPISEEDFNNLVVNLSEDL